MLDELISKILSCSEEALNHYKNQNWPQLTIHLGHLISHAGELWAYFTSSNPPVGVSPDYVEDCNVVLANLGYINTDLSGRSGTGFTSKYGTDLDPETILLIIRLVIRLVEQFRDKK